MRAFVERQLHEYKVYLLALVLEGWLHCVTHTIFQELLLFPYTVHEVLEFDISIYKTHFCLGEIFEISFLRRWGTNKVLRTHHGT